MKLLITFLIIFFFIIDGIQNVPVIHPIHVHTIPLHPVTAQPTSARIPTLKPIVPSDTTIQPTEHSEGSSSISTPITDQTPSSTTPHHSSWRYNSQTAGRISLLIFLHVLVVTLVCKVLERVCKSKKEENPCKKECPVVVKNKMSISTIDGQREQSPPPYAQIHNI